MKETPWNPSWGEARKSLPQDEVTCRRPMPRFSEHQSSEHPPPPAPSRFSIPSLTLVVGDVTAVARPSCQQRQEETKLQKKFPDFAAPHGSRRLSSLPP